MKNVIRLTESDLIRIIKRTINEEESEYYEIPAEEYKKLLVMTGYNGRALSRIRKFGGKKIRVIGDLDLNGQPVTDLGELSVVGTLNIGNTKIKSLDGVTSTRHVYYYGTPYEDKLKLIERQKKLSLAQDRREEDVWNINNTDEEGIKANIAFDYAVSEGLLKAISEEERIELNGLETRLKELSDRMEIEEDPELLSEMEEDYDEIQERIDELSNYVDVYDLIPTKYNHYDMSMFESYTEGISFAVGTKEEADESLYEWVEQLIDDVGYNGFNRWIVERNIDGDEVANDFEDMFREWIYEDPRNYDIVRLPSKQQYEEIWLLEMEKWVYENMGVRAPIKYPTKEEGNVFDFYDSENNEFQLKKEGGRMVLYNDGNVVQPGQIYEDEETEEHKREREKRISYIESEIEDIKEEPDGELDEDSVEEAVEDKKYEISNDPKSLLDELGYDYKDYINKEKFIKDVVSEETYSALSSYDGQYDETKFNDVTYIVLRVD